MERMLSFDDTYPRKGWHTIMKANASIGLLITASLLLAVLLPAHITTAQITVTKSHMQQIMNVGHRMHVWGLDGSVTVNVGKKGGPNIYDFSGLSQPRMGSPMVYSVPEVPSLASRYNASGFSFGDSPTQLEDNPVMMFKGDTLLTLGVVKINSQSHLVQHFLPTPVTAIFPGVMGMAWTQSYEHRETTYVSGAVTAVDSRHTTTDFVVDGFGTLRLPDREVACLRFVWRDIAPGTKDLKFQYLTQEGIAFEVWCWTDQPDTGIVTAWATRLIMKESLVGVSGEELPPGDFVLHPNYPNPFNPTTRLAFSLANQGKAVLRVFDLFGREVRTVFDGEATAGRTHQVVFDGAGLSSGMYIVRLESGNRVASRKIMLMK